MSYDAIKRKERTAQEHEAQKIAGVNWNRQKKRWIAGTDSSGYLGSYILKVDCIEAMGLGKVTAKARESQFKGVRNDPDYCEIKQKHLSGAWS